MNHFLVQSPKRHLQAHLNFKKVAKQTSESANLTYFIFTTKVYHLIFKFRQLLRNIQQYTLFICHPQHFIWFTYFSFHDATDDTNNHDHRDTAHTFVIFGNLLHFFTICNTNKPSSCWKTWHCKIISSVLQVSLSLLWTENVLAMSGLWSKM